MDSLTIDQPDSRRWPGIRGALAIITTLLVTLGFAPRLNAEEPANVLGEAAFSSAEIGSVPGSPWRTSDGDEGITVRTATLEADGEDRRWVELRDSSGEAPASASLRQQFDPVRNGRFSLRLHLAEDHASELGIYLGKGEASSTADRVVDMKTNQRGVLRVGTRGNRENTPLVLQPGKTYHFFIEFISANRDRFLLFVLGTYDENGDEEILARIEAPGPPEPVTGLRITTDNDPSGAHFFVTDPLLIDRDK